MKIVVQMLVHNEPFEEMDQMLLLLEQVDYPKDRWGLVIVNNRFPGHDVAAHFEKRWRSQVGVTLPDVIFQTQENNGFANGHNDAYRLAQTLHPDAIYLLNGDAEIDPGFLTAIARHAAEHPHEAIIQSRIMLAQDRRLLNTCGNCMHYLGFGFSDGYRQTPEEATKKPRPHFYASGAGMFIRVSLLETIGGLFPETFMYHEDVDVCWRARLAGFEIGYAEDSVMYHRYEFSRSIKKFYWMERNRHVTNLVNYRLATLLLIALPMLVMELGTFGFAIKSGWWKEKIRVWLYFLQASTWVIIWKRRKSVQSFRVSSDRAMLEQMVGTIEAQEIENPIVTYLVNPILSVYFSLVKAIVRW